MEIEIDYYLMSLILVDGFDGENLVGGQITSTADNSKCAIPNNVNVLEGEGAGFIPTVASGHCYGLVPNLLHYTEAGVNLP